VNPSDPLAGLHPLREPPPVGWWPPAPGWWLLLAVLLAALLALGWLLLRRYRASAYRKRALAQLLTLREERLERGDPAGYLAGTNALLKGIALHAWPRAEVAAKSGEAWLAFLNDTMPEGERFDPEFVTAAYQRECPDIDLEAVHQSAVTWIRHHRAVS
jgi:hypothetical protein